MAGPGLSTSGGGQSYDNPQRMSYAFGIHDFGAGGEAWAIPVPAGKQGCIIEEIAIHCIGETFNSDTTSAAVQLGIAGTLDKFAELGAENLADTDAIGIATGKDITASPGTADVLRDNSYGGKGVVLTSSAGDNITQIEVTFVAPTGGTPAGKGSVTIVLGWF